MPTRPGKPPSPHRSRRQLALIVCAVLVVGAGAGCAPATDASSTGSSNTSHASEPGTGRKGTRAPAGAGKVRSLGTGPVVKEVDGDTLHVRLDGRDETVRLIGIDTPETKKPQTPVECFGKEASAHLAELTPVGTELRIERDAEERDRYGRLLAYAFRTSDGLFVNLAMVSDGYASELTIPPNVAHVDEFTAAARDARQNGRGLWSSCGGNHRPA